MISINIFLRIKIFNSTCDIFYFSSDDVWYRDIIIIFVLLQTIGAFITHIFVIMMAIEVYNLVFANLCI
jgi:hypothetical protein